MIKILISFILVVCGCSAKAQVLYSQEEALSRAFSDNKKVKSKTLVVTPALTKIFHDKYNVEVPSSVISYFEEYDDNNNTLSYAFINSGVVRTHQALFMIVISDQGTLKDVFVLSFSEPPEYLPTEKWLSSFKSKKTSEPLLVGRDIPTVLGSTLTVNAITNSTRRIEAIFNEMLDSKQQL